ncbi:nucleotidyltransferase domain-containing protein [Chloroflexi bacterium CFX6]|nr:nucleotidyltransferase domain-containing protein [Chloroflexi bacterium CFX6]
MTTSVLAHDLKTVRKIVLSRLRPRDAKVYLFGSHATEKARRHSDIDIAILPLRRLAPNLITEIREELEESDVVRNVDIVDLSETDEAFRRRVLKEGILWKE